MGKIESEIRISFIDSNIYLAISTNKTFFKPPGLFSSLHESVTKRRLQQYLKELNFMLAFIDDLALNTRGTFSTTIASTAEVSYQHRFNRGQNS